MIFHGYAIDVAAACRAGTTSTAPSARRSAPVVDTIRYVANETDVWVELTTLLIPGLDDSDDESAA